VPTAADRLARHVLRAPDFVRRLAATQATEPVEAWMLQQDKQTRESYVREVLDQGGADARAEIWMLRQPDHVRESYISQVLDPKLQPTQR
jgi:hypothetical protein